MDYPAILESNQSKQLRPALGSLQKKSAPGSSDPLSHPGAEELLRKNGFSVNRSEVPSPSSRNAVDITIEQTIICHKKSLGGFVGFSRNHLAYYRCCIARHTRASYHQAIFEIADMDSQECTSQKDLRSS